MIKALSTVCEISESVYGSTIQLGGAGGSAPASRAGDPGSSPGLDENPAPDENFLLDLTT